jgi:NADPH-dependent ferric siderophore reductase
MPAMRDYTPRRYDQDTLELDIDFVLHGDGPAATWAEHAKPGQFLHIAGPRGSMIVPDIFDSYLLIGDETALPAIARRLEGLAANRRALVIVEVENGAEQQRLESAAQINVIWVLREGGKNNLLTTVKQLQVPSGNLYAWVATETKVSRQIRRVLLDEHGLNEQFVKTVGYWRLDQSDEE